MGGGNTPSLNLSLMEDDTVLKYPTSLEMFPTAPSKKSAVSIPIWEKANLTLEEAAAYSGIGINKLRTLSDSDECKFVLWVGSKRLIKRKLFDSYINNCYSI